LQHWQQIFLPNPHQSQLHSSGTSNTYAYLPPEKRNKEPIDLDNLNFSSVQKRDDAYALLKILIMCCEEAFEFVAVDTTKKKHYKHRKQRLREYIVGNCACPYEDVALKSGVALPAGFRETFLRLQEAAKPKTNEQDKRVSLLAPELEEKAADRPTSVEDDSDGEHEIEGGRGASNAANIAQAFAATYFDEPSPAPRRPPAASTTTPQNVTECISEAIKLYKKEKNGKPQLRSLFFGVVFHGDNGIKNADALEQALGDNATNSEALIQLQLFFNDKLSTQGFGAQSRCNDHSLISYLLTGFANNKKMLAWLNKPNGLDLNLKINHDYTGSDEGTITARQKAFRAFKRGKKDCSISDPHDDLRLHHNLLPRSMMM
jgi:hypothetical protein